MIIREARVLFAVAVALLGACHADDEASAGRVTAQLTVDAGPSRTDATPLRRIDTRPLSPEELEYLVSDEPIPPPIPLPIPAPPELDTRALYRSWLQDSGTVRMIVRVESLTPATGGNLAGVDVLASSPAWTAPPNEFLFHDGMSCEVGNVYIGETLLIHVSSAHLSDADRGVVPIRTATASPILSRVHRDSRDHFLVEYPWGNEEFGSAL